MSGILDENQFNAEFGQFQQEFPGFGELILLTKEGKIVFSTKSGFFTDEDAKTLINTWFTHQSAVVWGTDRFPILNWEELQFAARNVHGKGALVGTKTKSGLYAVVHIKPDGSIPPSLGAIHLNRWIWNRC